MTIFHEHNYARVYTRFSGNTVHKCEASNISKLIKTKKWNQLIRQSSSRCLCLWLAALALLSKNELSIFFSFQVFNFSKLQTHSVVINFQKSSTSNKLPLIMIDFSRCKFFWRLLPTSARAKSCNVLRVFILSTHLKVTDEIVEVRPWKWYFIILNPINLLDNWKFWRKKNAQVSFENPISASNICMVSTYRNHISVLLLPVSIFLLTISDNVG